MSPDEAAILDVYRFGRLALSFVADMEWSAFAADAKTQQASLHALTLMGEAVKRLSAEFRERYPDVNWADIAGMRDVFVHAYHRVELHEVWEILTRHLPGLLDYIEPLVPREE